MGLLHLAEKIYHSLNEASAAISAIATLFIAIFTLQLKKLGREQADIASKQVDIASKQCAISAEQTEIQIKQREIIRQEFFATHRPILRIRRIWPTGAQTTFLGNSGFEVRIIVANIGQSAAKITAISKSMIFDRKKADRAGFEANTETSDYSDNPIIVFPGMQSSINLFSKFDITSARYGEVGEGSSETLAIGVISYVDELAYGDSPDRVYVTGFSRLYDPAINRFRPVSADDPESDREYEN